MKKNKFLVCFLIIFYNFVIQKAYKKYPSRTPKSGNPDATPKMPYEKTKFSDPKSGNPYQTSNLQVKNLSKSGNPDFSHSPRLQNLDFQI